MSKSMRYILLFICFMVVALCFFAWIAPTIGAFARTFISFPDDVQKLVDAECGEGFHTFDVQYLSTENGIRYDAPNIACHSYDSFPGNTHCEIQCP
jgi:hypothetical protein